MLLIVVLIIFTLVLSTISVGLFIWWRKYGKDMYYMIKKINNTSKNQSFPFDTEFLNQNLDILKNFLNKK